MYPSLFILLMQVAGVLDQRLLTGGLTFDKCIYIDYLDYFNYSREGITIKLTRDSATRILIISDERGIDGTNGI